MAGGTGSWNPKGDGWLAVGDVDWEGSMADGHHGGTCCCTASSGSENQDKATSWNGR